MSDIDSRVRELLVNRGIPVPGTDERALCRDDALRCVSLSLQGATPILGGDVYYLRDAGLEPAYANWHTDRFADESQVEFLERTCESARRYIAAFPEHPGNQPVFVIVRSPK
jgi:hypothetical protein